MMTLFMKISSPHVIPLMLSSAIFACPAAIQVHSCNFLGTYKVLRMWEDLLTFGGCVYFSLQGNSRSAGVKSRKFWAWHNANWRNRISEQDASECQRWLLSGEIHDEATPPKLRYSTSCSTEDILGQKRRRYITTVTPDNAL
jgi:hypothetical protein